MNRYDYKDIHPFKWFVLENFPFIEADFDALTNWQLFCKIGKQINKIIDNQNEVGNTVETFTQNFVNLYNYVHDFFVNLDVQDEIDHKLDEMVEDGIFENILSNYANLQRVYATSSDMIEDYSNLFDGMKIKTLGYYSINDGGKGEFYITDTQPSTDEFFITLANSLYAVLLPKNSMINAKSCGAKGDNETDDTTILQKALNTKYNLYLPAGTYLTSDTLVIPFNKEIYGENRTKSIINGTGSSKYILKYGSSYNYGNYSGIIKDIQLKSTNGIDSKPYGIYLNSGIKIENCSFNAISKAIDRVVNYIDMIELKNIYFAYCIPNGASVVNLKGNGDALKLTQIKFEAYADDTTNYNGISIDTSHGGSINDSILNCVLNFSNASAFSVNNCHFENVGKSINIVNSSVDFNNCFKFKNNRDQANDFIITTSTYAFANQIKLSNFVFTKKGTNYGENLNEEFDAIPMNTSLILNNVCRLFNFGDTGSTSAITTGIQIKNNTIFNTLSSILSKNSTIIGSKIYAPKIEKVSESSSSLGTTGKTGVTKWLANDVEVLHYRALVLCDDTRKIITGYSSDVSITSVQNNGNAVAIAVNNVKYNTDIVLYRGLAVNEYDSVCIVNNSRTRLIDNGNNCLGNAWTTVTQTNGTENYNNYSRFEKNGNNVVVYGTTTPTVGTWQKYDKVVNTSIASGNVKSWIYDGANWVSDGTY